MAADDKIDKDVRSWIGSESVDAIANYAERGRTFAGLSDLELSAAWVQAFTSWAHDIRNRELRAKQADYSAEFSLRGMKPPYDLVREEQDLLQAGFKKWVYGLTTDELENFCDRVEKDFNEFQDKRDKGQN